MRARHVPIEDASPLFADFVVKRVHVGAGDQRIVAVVAAAEHVPVIAIAEPLKVLENHGFPCIVNGSDAVMFQGPQACVVIIDGIPYPVSYAPFVWINGVEIPVCFPVQ